MSGVGLNVGNLPVKQVYVGSTPVKAVYVGSELVWSATVQITLGTGLEARDQFRDALSARGLGYQTVTKIPFDIELVGSGSARNMFQDCSALTHVPGLDTSSVTDMNTMFRGCSSLTHAPDLDTSGVTNMGYMFYDCSSLAHVPDMDTSQVTYMRGMFSNCNSMNQAPALNTPQVVDSAYMFSNCSSLTYVPDMDTSQNTDLYAMFENCSSLTDGNVRLSVRLQGANTGGMLQGSGLTYEPFTVLTHQVSLTGVVGTNVAHALTTLTIPKGQTWQVRIQGQITEASGVAAHQPFFRIGAVDGAKRGIGAVDVSGTVTSTAPRVALVTASAGSLAKASFTGTVTIAKP